MDDLVLLAIGGAALWFLLGGTFSGILGAAGDVLGKAVGAVTGAVDAVTSTVNTGVSVVRTGVETAAQTANDAVSGVRTAVETGVEVVTKTNPFGGSNPFGTGSASGSSAPSVNPFSGSTWTGGNALNLGKTWASGGLGSSLLKQVGVPSEIANLANPGTYVGWAQDKLGLPDEANPFKWADTVGGWLGL
jgi:hypothetical protein